MRMMKRRGARALPLLATLALTLVLSSTGCSATGGTPQPSQPAGPPIERTQDGRFFAQVKDRNAALDAASAQRQPDLAQQLKKAGAPSGLQTVAFVYDQDKFKSYFEHALAPIALTEGQIATAFDGFVLVCVKVP
jgi:hypothetical protein